MPNEETHFTNKDRETLIEVRTKLDRAITDISNLGSNYADKGDHNTLVKRVDALEDNNKWIIRTILTIIIAAVMGGIIITTRQ